GSVIDHSRRQAPAPSSAAASWSVSGSDWSAARNSRKLKPTVHHTVSAAIDHMATSSSDSQPTGSIPSAVTSSVASPTSGWYSHDQISVTTVTGSRYGAK